MPVFLDQIVAATRLRVAERRRGADVRELERRAAAHGPRGFRRQLAEKAEAGVAVIAELKQASPSKGILRSPLDVPQVAREYEAAGAAALSVLTEEQFFLGSLENLAQASAACSLPCLRKDFIIDEFQILEARAHHADAILLIAAILSDEELASLHRGARELGLDVLCEVHDAHELERVVAAGADIIGVNSRDLRSFVVDLETAVRLSPQIPGGVLRVAESGIHTPADIARLRASGYNAFLVGEAFMRAPSPGAALADLLRGTAQAARP